MKRLLVFAIFAVLVCAGCNDSGARIHFVLPDGLKGLIEITQDEDRGLVVHEHEGRFTYTIPPDGQLHVQSLRPFTRWHKQSAVYQSGAVLQTGTDDNVADDTVALRDLDSSISNNVTTVRYFVGTKKDEAGLR
jgi:hypothetical protein